ncbi:MAG: right-handed parallel beta-helix repeat-containing protein [Betaproteobacteria bacterium]|nr:right-handed parallel beta-helix repeat-containing protein [Betaproteobacteria bacterium]
MRALALLLLLPLGAAQAATRYVGACGSPTNPTLAAAIAAASSGDTLLVCPGAYNEAVTVNKDNLTIAGSTGNRANVTVTHSGRPFTLTGANLTLKDMTITSTGDRAIYRGWTGSPSAYTFQNLAVTADDKGIHIEVAGKITMTSVTATSRDDSAIYLESGVNGAHVFDTVTATGKEYGLYNYYGGVSYTNVTAASQDKPALYLRPRYDTVFTNITATSEDDRAIELRWVNTAKALTFTNVTATGKGEGIYVEVSGKVRMENVTAASDDESAIRLESGSSGAHEFENVRATGRQYGLYTYNGGALFKDITATAREEDALYLRPAYDAAFTNVTATSSKGLGLNMGWVGTGRNLTFDTLRITSEETGLHLEVARAVTLRNIVAASSKADGIRLGWAVAGPITADNLTLDAKDSGLRLQSSTTAPALSNLCVNSGDTGILLEQWGTRSVSISNSKFSASRYGVDVRTDPNYRAVVSNSCFMKSSPPRAQSNSTRHTFDGNYWQGVAAGSSVSDGNVRGTGALAACPVTSCYAYTPPGPATPAVLVGDWRLDEGPWVQNVANTLADSSGNGLTGRAYSDVASASGKLCQAAAFTSAGAAQSGLLAQDNAKLDVASVTMTAWVYPTAYGGWDSIVNRWAAYNMLMESNGLFRARMAVGGTDDAPVWRDTNSVGLYTLPLNAWSMVATTYDGRYTRTYVYNAAGAYLGGQTYDFGSSLPLRNSIHSVRIGSWAASAPQEQFDGKIDEVKVFSGAMSRAEIDAIAANEVAGRNWNGTVRTCAAPPSAPAALNATNTGANPASGKITTKVAGSAFQLDLHALNAGRTATDAAFNGEILVDLLANAAAGAALDANNCPTGAAALSVGAATLSAGKASVSIPGIANSWRDVRVRMRYPATGAATVTACSADNFAVKPASLSVAASHADWQTAGTAAALANTGASGGALHKAGRPFTLRVTGYNAGNAVTSNYDGAPAPALACVLPASGCVAGNFSVGAFSASGGTLTSNTASYSEVGAVALSLTDTGYAGVDSGDTAASCAGYHVCASAQNVGRFVPDHFDVSANTPTFTPGCGRFTYTGQPFLPALTPVLTVSAKNAGGGITANYTGNLWKLDASGLNPTWSAASGTITSVDATLPAPTLSDLGTGSGTFSFGLGNGLRFTRSGPVTPFNASLNLAATLTDSEGVAYSGNPYTLTGIGFTGGGNVVRFGRLRMANAAGSERLALPAPVTAQYWNGQGYVTNTDDACTALPAPTLTFFPQSADNLLASGETTATYNSPLIAGSGGLRLSAPGAGNPGYLEAAFTAPEWLRYNWDGIDQTGDASGLYDDNPRARVSFGIRKGRDKVILRRELY